MLVLTPSVSECNVLDTFFKMLVNSESDTIQVRELHCPVYWTRFKCIAKGKPG